MAVRVGGDKVGQVGGPRVSGEGRTVGWYGGPRSRCDEYMMRFGWRERIKRR